jgi:hypothetical protein
MKTILLLAMAAALSAQVPIGTNTGGGGGGGGAATAIRSGLLSAIPATCAVSDRYYATDATITTGLSRDYVCTATDTWTQQGPQANGDGSITITSSASGAQIIGVTPGVLPTASYVASTMTASCVDGLAAISLVIARGSNAVVCRSVNANNAEYAGHTFLASNTTGILTWWTSIPITTTTANLSIWGLSRFSFTTGTVSGRFRTGCASSTATGDITWGSWVNTNTPTNTNAVNDRVFQLTSTVTHGCTIGQLTGVQFSRTNPGGSADVYLDFFQMGLQAQ